MLWPSHDSSSGSSYDQTGKNQEETESSRSVWWHTHHQIPQRVPLHHKWKSCIKNINKSTEVSFKSHFWLMHHLCAQSNFFFLHCWSKQNSFHVIIWWVNQLSVASGFRISVAVDWTKLDFKGKNLLFSLLLCLEGQHPANWMATFACWHLEFRHRSCSCWCYIGVSSLTFTLSSLNCLKCIFSLCCPA